MSRLRTITRRTFLAVGTVIGGAAAFGYYQVQRTPANPLDPAPGQEVFNPWVIVGPEKVTIITPRAEMGQGSHTTLAALVAEEMDLRWDQIETEHGPTAAAYYNATLVALGIPFAEYQESRLKSVAHGTFGAAGKVLGIQATGGSTSTVDAYDKMRLAGASARAMLVNAAAQRLNTDASLLTTKDGAVVDSNGNRIPYGDLAAEAVTLDPPSDPPLKDPEDWIHLGKPMPRVDIVAKSTGTADFGVDVTMPGMVYASVKVNPVLGAEVTSFNATEAENMAGVQRVIDIGDGVAVVADNTWIAMRAAELVELSSGPAPYPADTDAIMEKIAQTLNEDADDTLRDDGDVDSALTQTAAETKVVEAEYQLPYLAHATMEPMNATALLDNGTLDIWVGSQAPTIFRQKAADLAGLAEENVNVHVQYLGGGFGRRGEYDVTLQAVKVAMAMPGTPVKLTWSREEDMRHDYYRPGAIARMQGVVGKDGPTALDAKVAAASVNTAAFNRLLGFSPIGPDRYLSEGAFDQPYNIANYRVSGHRADVSIPIGYWRSVGYSHNAFFTESFIDELAHAGGLDPLQMRLDLVKDLDAPSAKALETIAEMSSWGKDLPANHARGLAFCHSYGAPVAQVIEISQQEDGIKLEHIWAVIDVGIAMDPRNIEAQISSGIVFGLSAAIMGEITFADAMVEQQNFPDYDALRMWQVPPITVKVLENNAHITGAGEPGTPPAAPALTNAVFALTGERFRKLPLHNHLNFQ